MSTQRPPEWFQNIADEHDVILAYVENLHGSDAWGCQGDCSCSFIIADNHYIDRFSYVNEAGWCQGQHCPCHDFPRERPEDT